MTLRVYVGSFETEAAFLAAAKGAGSAGLDAIDAVTPYPVHGVDAALGVRPSRLPYATAAAGFVGAAFGMGFQYWASAVDWPVNVGGRPFDSWPAFVPVAFEITILFAGLATVGALAARSRFGRRPNPSRVVAGTTDDVFALFVRRRPDAGFFGDPAAYLRASGAAKVAEVAS
jgi:hypothetical protein